MTDDASKLPDVANAAAQVFETSPHSLALLDRKFRFYYVNQTFLDRIGMKSEDVLGATPESTIGAQVFNEILKPRLQECLEGTQVSFRAEFIIDDLGKRWMDIRYVPLYDGDGEVCAISSISHDVTDEVRAKEGLERERFFVRQVEEVMGAGVFVWDVAEQRNLYCSDSLAHIQGMTPEELERNIDSEEADVALAIPEDRPHLAEAYAQSRLYGAPLDVEYRIEHPEKGVRWIREVGVRQAIGDDNRVVTMGLLHDVTDRKDREQELETQRLVAEQAEKVAKIGFWMWDLAEDRSVYFSDQAAAIHGMTREEFAKTQKSPEADLSRIHPDDYARVGEAISRTRKTGETFDEEYRINLPDGSIRWVEEIGVAHSVVNGKINQLIGTLQDITERKQREEDLRQRDIIYRQIEENISIGYWTWDEIANKPIYVSGGIPKIYGLTTNEFYESMSGSGVEISLVHPQDRDLVIETSLRFKETFEPYDMEYRILYKDDSVRWVHEVASPLQVSDEGVMQTSIGTLRDITARKVEEEDLRRREVMFQQIEDNFGVGFWTWNIEAGVMDYISDSCVNVYGRDRNDLVMYLASPERYLEIIHPGDQQLVNERQSRYLSGQLSSYDLEYRIIQGDGAVRWVHSVSAPLKINDDGSVIVAVGVVRDVTQRREREEELERAKEAAERASLAKSDFLAHMSHELRTPLNAVIGFSDAIRSEIYGPLGDERYQDYLDNIQNSGRLLLALINDLLDMSAIEAGEMSIEPEPQNMDELVSEMFDLAGPSSQVKNITLTKSPELKNLNLMIDPRRFRQIILNLVINAVKYTNDHGKVAVSGHLDGEERAVISVRDNGIGMTEDEAEAALIPFKQIKNATIRQIEGTGIGLPLTNRLVELHLGTMKIESEKNKGTAVVITLPAERTVQ